MASRSRQMIVLVMVIIITIIPEKKSSDLVCTIAQLILKPSLPQVWAGTDACEPVTWQECKLVPKDVKFIVPEIKCEPKQELWYHEPEEVTPLRDHTKNPRCNSYLPPR